LSRGESNFHPHRLELHRVLRGFGARDLDPEPLRGILDLGAREHLAEEQPRLDRISCELLVLAPGVDDPLELGALLAAEVPVRPEPRQCLLLEAGVPLVHLTELLVALSRSCQKRKLVRGTGDIVLVGQVDDLERQLLRAGFGREHALPIAEPMHADLDRLQPQELLDLLLRLEADVPFVVHELPIPARWPVVDPRRRQLDFWLWLELQRGHSQHAALHELVPRELLDLLARELRASLLREIPISL